MKDKLHKAIDLERNSLRLLSKAVEETYKEVGGRNKAIEAQIKISAIKANLLIAQAINNLSIDSKEACT
jgi:hypothetical protein